MAPGVTYEDNGDTWREVFHYPTDGSPQPPEASAPRPDSHSLSSATPSSLAAEESSSKASVVAIMAEWDDVDGHDFLDEVLSGRIRDVASASVSDPPGLAEDKTQDPHPPPLEDPTRPGIWPSEGDVMEASVLQGDGVNHVTTPPPLPRGLGNTNSDNDELNNTMSSTSNATLHKDQAFAVGHGPLFPTDGDSLGNESLLLNDNIHHDSLSLVSNDTLDDYSLSATSNDTQNNFLSTTVVASQNSHSLFVDDVALENSSLQPKNNNTQDSGYMLANDDVNSTSHSPPVQDDVLVVSPTLRAPLEHTPTGVGRSAGSGVTQEVWYTDGAAPGTEPINDPSASGFVVQQASEQSTAQSQISRHSPAQVDTSTVAIHSSLPRIRTQPGSPTVTTVRVQAGLPAVTVKPSTPTGRVQPGNAASTAHLGVSDLTVTKSSSQVT